MGERLRDEAERWQISPSLAPKLLIAPFLVAIAVLVLAAVDPRLLRDIGEEDFVVEWAQFFAFLVAAGAGGIVAMRARAQGRLGWALAYALFAVGCVLVAGEEIAWGQRLLGFGTPEAVERLNDQRSTTVHNLTSVQAYFDRAFTLTALFGTVAPFTASRIGILRDRETLGLWVPPRFLAGFFVVALGYGIARVPVDIGSYPYTSMYAEWAELLVATALAIFAALNARLLRPTTAVSTKAQVSDSGGAERLT